MEHPDAPVRGSSSASALRVVPSYSHKNQKFQDRSFFFSYISL